MEVWVSVCLSATTVLKATVFLIKLSGDKRVLTCVYVCVVYGTYRQVVCVHRERGEKRPLGANSWCSYDPHYHDCTCH